MLKLIHLFIPVLLPIALGYFIRFTKLFTGNEITVLRKFIINVSVPFLIFKSLYKADMNSFSQIAPASFGFFFLTGLFAVTAYAATRLFPNFFSANIERKNTYIFTAFIGNYAFLGWGVLYSLYGEQAFTRAVFYTMFFWPVFLFWGFALVYFLKKKRKRSDSSLLKIVIKRGSIPLLAAISGLIFNRLQIGIPDSLWQFIEQFASFTIPLILFTIGVNFDLKIRSEDLKVVLSTGVHRLLFGFFLGLLTLLVARQLFTVDEITARVILIESIMPTAAMSIFYLDHIEMDRELMSKTITITTLGSLATIPFWYYIIEKLF